jgi:S-adenosyl methyltransferase
MVLAHTKGLLADAGTATLIEADLRDPDRVLDHPGLRALVSLGEPAGLLMTAVMHFVAPAVDPWGIVAHYLAALAPGSYLVLSHATADRLPPRALQAGREEHAQATENSYLRPKAQVERFFGDLEPVPPYDDAPPGACYVGEWGAEVPALADSDGSRVMYCGVGRRP